MIIVLSTPLEMQPVHHIQQPGPDLYSSQCPIFTPGHSESHSSVTLQTPACECPPCPQCSIPTPGNLQAVSMKAVISTI